MVIVEPIRVSPPSFNLTTIQANEHILSITKEGVTTTIILDGRAVQHLLHQASMCFYSFYDVVPRRS